MQQLKIYVSKPGEGNQGRLLKTCTNAKTCSVSEGYYNSQDVIGHYAQGINPDYSFSTDIISFKVARNDAGIEMPLYSSDRVVLTQGWQLISVTSPMVGRSLAEIASSCEIDAAYIYTSDDRKPSAWLRVKPNAGKFSTDTFAQAINIIKFGSEHVGLGLFLHLRTHGGCSFGCGLTSCRS